MATNKNTQPTTPAFQQPAHIKGFVSEDALIRAVRVITRSQLKKLLGDISERTLQRMELAGEAPPKTRLSPGRIGYRACDVADWLDARRDANWQPIGSAAARVVANIKPKKCTDE